MFCLLLVAVRWITQKLSLNHRLDFLTATACSDSALSCCYGFSPLFLHFSNWDFVTDSLNRLRFLWSAGCWSKKHPYEIWGILNWRHISMSKNILPPGLLNNLEMTLDLMMAFQILLPCFLVFLCLCFSPRQARSKDLNPSCFKTCSSTPWCRSWEHLMRWSSWSWGTPTWRMSCCSAWRGPWRAARLRSLCSISTSTSSARTGLTSCSMFWESSLRSKGYSKSQEPRAHITATFEKESQEKGKKSPSKPVWEHYSF